MTSVSLGLNGQPWREATESPNSLQKSLNESGISPIPFSIYPDENDKDNKKRESKVDKIFQSALPTTQSAQPKPLTPFESLFGPSFNRDENDVSRKLSFTQPMNDGPSFQISEDRVPRKFSFAQQNKENENEFGLFAGLIDLQALGERESQSESRSPLTIRRVSKLTQLDQSPGRVKSSSLRSDRNRPDATFLSPAPSVPDSESIFALYSSKARTTRVRGKVITVKSPYIGSDPSDSVQKMRIMGQIFRVQLLASGTNNHVYRITSPEKLIIGDKAIDTQGIVVRIPQQSRGDKQIEIELNNINNAYDIRSKQGVPLPKRFISPAQYNDPKFPNEGGFAILEKIDHNLTWDLFTKTKNCRELLKAPLSQLTSDEQALVKLLDWVRTRLAQNAELGVKRESELDSTVRYEMTQKLSKEFVFDLKPDNIMVRKDKSFAMIDVALIPDSGDDGWKIDLNHDIEKWLSWVDPASKEAFKAYLLEKFPENWATYS